MTTSGGSLKFFKFRQSPVLKSSSLTGGRFLNFSKKKNHIYIFLNFIFFCLFGAHVHVKSWAHDELNFLLIKKSSDFAS